MPQTMILELWNCLGEIFNKKHWELHSHQLTDLYPNPCLVLYVLYPKIHQNLETWNPFKTSHRGKEPKEPLGKPGNETWNIPQGLGIKMGISENSGAPKSPILIGFSSINHPFWGTFIFGNTHLRRVAQMFIEVSWNLKRTCSKSLPVFSEETSAQARQSCPWGSHNRDVAGHGKGFRFRQILTFWLFELGGLFFSQFLFVSKCDYPFFWKFFLLAGWLDLLALFCRLGLADDYWVTLVRRFSPFSGG